MIPVQKIYDATRGGLDIILSMYPQAQECVGVKGKKFKVRDEKTPSACLYQRKSEKFGEIWGVTDFGGEGWRSAIDLYMEEHRFGQDRFNEAVLQLAAQFNVTDELDRSVNKADFTERDARADEPDGHRDFETKDFTPEELAVLGPNVKQEHVEALHWHSVKWFSYTKDRKTRIRYSNEHYPIFMRECVVKEARTLPDGTQQEEVKFYKVYEPLNPDKGYRFQYFPAGVKPQKYINGLRELIRAKEQFNANEQKEWERTHTDEEPYKPQKLREAFICSGERDALCCRSLGYMPLWFNSETYHLSEEEVREIMQHVETLYNIPDIDETGIRKGTELALRFIDIRTVWLPDWLSSYRDNRGKPRKDLRDWMELRHTKKEFRFLMQMAMPARFWKTNTNKKTGEVRHAIDTACLYNFLKLNGFYALHDDNQKDTRYVKIDGYIVRSVTPKDIREFVRQWVIDEVRDLSVLNLVLDTPKLSAGMLESIDEVTLDFTSFDARTQFFFFPNVCVKASGQKLDVIKKQDFKFQNYVWEENVISHDFKLLDDFFTITRTTDEDGQPQFSITINKVGANLMGYMINSSRLFWRKEMELPFENESYEKKLEYQTRHRFDIAGEGLTADEQREQQQNLINKIFAMGYMLHHYKSPSRAWAPMAMDNKIGEDDECNGRSGKSFFFKVLSLLMKTVKLSGRNPKLMDNPHVFDQVTQHTQMLLVDDCDRYLNTGLFYDNITSDMTVNPKNNQSFTIPFEDSPKIAFTTNYVPADFDPSSEARLLYMVFSDYYHQKTEDNDYRESRSIRDDFNKDLFSKTYSEDEWNQDLNFILQCVKFYLSVCDEPIKLLPPMANIIYRKHKQDMGSNFEDWAQVYFGLESGRLDAFVPRIKAFEDFKSHGGRVQGMTPQTFMKKLAAFALLCPWVEELNPKELRNSSGRITRREEGAAPGSSPVEMIYMKKKAEAPKNTPSEAELWAQEHDDEPF